MLNELLYGGFLIIHILFGVSYIDHVPINLRRWACTALGVLTSLVLSRSDIFHQLFLCGLTCLIIMVHRVIPKFSLYMVLNVLAFGYLLVFRFLSDNNFSNLIQMMLTLRLAGLGSELTDVLNKEQDAPILDVFHYSFSYIGLLAGPYVRFRTFLDYVNGVCETTSEKRKPFLDYRLRQLPVLMAAFLISNFLAPVGAAKTSQFHAEHGFLYKYWYMTLMFIAFRSRLYCGFILAECGCIAAGLGAYPRAWASVSGGGPKDRNIAAISKNVKDIDFNTVYNTDLIGCEGAPTVKETIRSWNKTVQYWLAVNCHKKLSYSRGLRMAITLGVSAFWHGVRPGYYLCLCTTAFFVIIEDRIVSYLHMFPSPPQNLPAKILFAQIKMQVFAYMGMAFVMMNLGDIYMFYKNLYFVGHIAIIVGYVLFFVVLKKPKRRER